MDIRKIDSELSNKLSNASFLFMGFIVGIHVLGHGWQTVEQGSALWYWVALGQYGLFNIAVPFFFMCSGFCSRDILEKIRGGSARCEKEFLRYLSLMCCGV